MLQLLWFISCLLMWVSSRELVLKQIWFGRKGYWIVPWLHWPRDEPRQTFPTCLTCSLNLAEAGLILIGKQSFQFCILLQVLVLIWERVLIWDTTVCWTAAATKCPFHCHTSDILSLHCTVRCRVLQFWYECILMYTLFREGTNYLMLMLKASTRDLTL